jgi:thiamine biosynthesis protein ThiS
MILIINGEQREFEKDICINEILQILDIKDATMAVALNSYVVKKDKWNSTITKENDKLEFLNFVGGG